mgnify:CR=1 FL=1|tara:strand:+ start:27239 stop:27991 length:753 start_codon:yes stop_codon:yes gene_type:complete
MIKIGKLGHRKSIYPLIGVTMDYELSGGYSAFNWYALRENYCGSVIRAGGIPLALPHELTLLDQYLELIDGLLITGGAFDIPPHLFGENTNYKSITTKEKRTSFELALATGAHNRSIPTLGICGGEQLMNVALGGTLVQHIPDYIKSSINHEQENPRDESSHPISIHKDSQLSKIVGTQEFHVNSAHHQAVRDIAPNLKVNANSPDGVIEGIEDPNHPWYIGVQWHPEFEISLEDSKLLKSFVKASSNER